VLVYVLEAIGATLGLSSDNLALAIVVCGAGRIVGFGTLIAQIFEAPENTPNHIKMSTSNLEVS
jgi:hypothetical protein